jgi:hypothetical protein
MFFIARRSPPLSPSSVSNIFAQVDALIEMLSAQEQSQQRLAEQLDAQKKKNEVLEEELTNLNPNALYQYDTNERTLTPVPSHASLALTPFLCISRGGGCVRTDGMCLHRSSRQSRQHSMHVFVVNGQIDKGISSCLPALSHGGIDSMCCSAAITSEQKTDE